MDDPAQRFDAIVSDFEHALVILEDVLRHISEFEPAPKLRVVMLNNTIVALSATIEETLRGIFQEYLSILEENIGDHRDLRKSLQKSNLECAVHGLRRYNRESDFRSAAALVSNLEKCLNGQPGYKLLKDQITHNQANFKSKQVNDTSKSVGVSDLWRRVCDCPEVEDYTGQTVVDARVDQLTASWNELFVERNLVVHQISQASGWGGERIRQSIELSRLVLRRIAECLAADGSDLIPAAQPDSSMSDGAGSVQPAT